MALSSSEHILRPARVSTIVLSLAVALFLNFLRKPLRLAPDFRPCPHILVRAPAALVGLASHGRPPAGARERRLPASRARLPLLAFLSSASRRSCVRGDCRRSLSQSAGHSASWCWWAIAAAIPSRVVEYIARGGRCCGDGGWLSSAHAVWRKSIHLAHAELRTTSAAAPFRLRMHCRVAVLSRSACLRRAWFLQILQHEHYASRPRQRISICQ